MFKCVVLIAVTTAAVVGMKGQGSRLVLTTQGPIRGYKIPERDLFAFYGIPYATAPEGIDKYKEPLPPPQWTSPFEAIHDNIVCPQGLYTNLTGKIQQENCLIANIYVPDTNVTSLPVLVYIHGGAYQFSYGNFWTAKELIKKKDMIVVNFNYRLGAHGFLCLGTENAPGNAGMKDQIALLRWVKLNIANFGGNRHDVTLIGCSAGSSSIDLLLLSPMAKGLFNKVIPETGAALSTFTVQCDPMDSAWNFAKLLNFTNTGNDIYALEHFYRTISFEEIFTIDVLNNTDSTFFFSPCVERVIGQEMFLHDAPLNIIKSGRNQKMPILSGMTEMEGLFRMPYFESWKQRMNENFSDFLPGDLTFPSIEEKQLVAEEVKKFYFGEIGVSENTIFRYIDYFTDTLFGYGIVRSAKLHVESGNNEVYLYQYSFVDRNTSCIPNTRVCGANHCAQSTVVGDNKLNAVKAETNDLRKMQEMMRDLWINFIITGKPVPENSALPEWPSADVQGGPYMLLDKSLKLQGSLLQQRVLFWDTIYDKYYCTPIPPTIPTEKKKSEQCL